MKIIQDITFIKPKICFVFIIYLLIHIATIGNYLLNNNKKIILFSKLGKASGQPYINAIRKKLLKKITGKAVTFSTFFILKDTNKL